MDPIDLFVAYVILSSVMAWVSVFVGPSALLLRAWKWRRRMAVADHEALELLAGRQLPGAGNTSVHALVGLHEVSDAPLAVRASGSLG